MKIRTYSELSSLISFEDRFEYLKLNGRVGSEKFGYDRYLNQTFYKSNVWKSIRNEVILRDDGCDLGIDDRPIQGKIIIHHLNPISLEDILDRKNEILNPEYLICVSNNTHQAIHYGDSELLIKNPIVRVRNDTKLW